MNLRFAIEAFACPSSSLKDIRDYACQLKIAIIKILQFLLFLCSSAVCKV